MMYNNKMAVAIKTGGKILREHKDTVYVPFGAEYSIVVRNLNTVRAMVNISIDGKDIADGKADFVVDANSEIDLTRFLTGGNMNQGNKFKFIERTAGIEQHRGVGVEDGIIRIEFQFERQQAPYVHPMYEHGKLYNRHDSNPSWTQSIGTAQVQSSSTLCRSASSATYSLNDSYAAKGADITVSNYVASDAGITVPGSVSDQKFQSVSGFALDGVKHVMVLRLFGESPEGKKIVEPVTVKSKPKCVTCGRVNKAGAKFCTECGTSLTIV